MAEIDSQLADATRTDPVAGVIADRQRVHERWDACSPAIQGQTVDALVTLTILANISRFEGSWRVRPVHVQVEWKR